MKKQLIKQPKNSQLCGPACLEMTLGALVKESFPTREIASELSISKEYGIGLFDLAAYPIKHGFKVDLFAWDSNSFPINWLNSKSAVVLASLRKNKYAKGSWKKALLDDLEMGAKFFPKPISVEEIKKRLSKGQQMVMYFNSAVLYGHGEGVWGHYVVIKKLTSKTWTILDPHWKFGGEKSYPADLLLFAFYSVGAYCFFISKKNGHVTE